MASPSLALRALPLALGSALILAHCGSDPSHGTGGTGHSGGSGHGAEAGTGGVAPAPTDECGSVRLTQYSASATGYCEFDRTLSILPASVQAGLTLAIAEPWVGSSYGGEPGEACGECWEIDTITDTRTVMVHDLCPIEGNPLCAGGHFHFDLSEESAAALHGGGLDEGSARRVPCPVTGNVFVQINDRNEWGYLRVAFVNHRIPIKTAEYRAANDTVWKPVQRSGGAFHVENDGQTFAKSGPGGVFRITSAQGEVVEMPNVLGYDAAKGSVFDLGGQLVDQAPSTGGACVFVPPADVYVDGYGGIDEVRWQMNPWGNATASEATSGCFGDKGSCIRVDSLDQWNGFHIYYRQPFPSSTFATLSLRVKAVGVGTTITVAPSLDGARCTETSVAVGASYTEVTLDLASVCAGQAEISAVTVDNQGASTSLVLDEVRFAK